MLHLYLRSLLSSRLIYGTKIRLVELFKTRFGPEGLQSCEVMLRDILESTRINTTMRPWAGKNFPTVEEIHAAVPEDGIALKPLLEAFQGRIPHNSEANKQFLRLVETVASSGNNGALLLPKPANEISAVDPSQFSTLILSSFFWPSLREDEFDVPEPIRALQKSFEKEFERMKSMRKLQWLSALGRVTVELELEDRAVRVEAVQTWQASVIYAFQNDENEDPNLPSTKTVQDLEEALSMEELLVRNAIAFWIGHRVLAEVEPDTYRVLEKLPSAEAEGEEGNALAAAPQAPPAPADAALSAIKSQDAVLRDNKDTYELFMVGMLTNGGAMDAARITMMMKLVVPGGYAFGEDETRWLLGDLVQQGKVMESGSSFAIKK